MIKFLTMLVLTTGTLADDGASQSEVASERPVIYNVLFPRFSPVYQILNVVCSVREFLNDREVSDRVYKIMDGVLQNDALSGMRCMNNLVVEEVNKPESAIGTALTILNSGTPVKITDFWDLFSSYRNPWYVILTLPMTLRQIDFRKVLEEAKRIVEKIPDKCGKESLEEVKADFNFLAEKFYAVQEKVAK